MQKNFYYYLVFDCSVLRYSTESQEQLARRELLIEVAYCKFTEKL